MNNDDVTLNFANKGNSFNAVQALMKELGISQGSVSTANPYKSYDLYTLIDSYIEDPEIRLQINKLIKGLK